MIGTAEALLVKPIKKSVELQKRSKRCETLPLQKFLNRSWNLSWLLIVSKLTSLNKCWDCYLSFSPMPPGWVALEGGEDRSCPEAPGATSCTSPPCPSPSPSPSPSLSLSHHLFDHTKRMTDCSVWGVDTATEKDQTSSYAPPKDQCHAKRSTPCQEIFAVSRDLNTWEVCQAGCRSAKDLEVVLEHCHRAHTYKNRQRGRANYMHLSANCW